MSTLIISSDATPKSKTECRPFLTKGLRNSIKQFTPNRDTPGRDAIGSLAFESVLKNKYNNIDECSQLPDCYWQSLG